MSDTILEEVNRVIQTNIFPRIEEIKKNCENVESENKRLSKECSDLKNQCSELKRTKESVEQQLNILRIRISQKTDDSSTNNKYDELSGKINNLSLEIQNKADAASTVSGGSMNMMRRKHGLNTCLFLCGVLIFNIIATWLIMYRPGYYDLDDISVLPWFYSLALVAVMLVNIAATTIWVYHYRFTKAAIKYRSWEAVTEICLLIFGTVAMWLFAFHPLEEVTGAVIALAVFLMLANVIAFLMRIIHFSYEHTSLAPDCDKASLAVSIIETVFLVVIFIIFVFGIRV